MEYESYNRPRRAKKPMTEQQALLKLTTLCTQSEHCSQEMLDKMKKWELAEDAIARNMQFLIEKKFIDDERYARFFINDKEKYSSGRRGAPAKGIGRETGARVQIPPSPFYLLKYNKNIIDRKIR